MVVWVQTTPVDISVFVSLLENLFRGFFQISERLLCSRPHRAMLDRVQRGSPVFPGPVLPLICSSVRPAVPPRSLSGAADYVPIKKNVFCVSVPIIDRGRVPRSLLSQVQRQYNSSQPVSGTGCVLGLVAVTFTRIVPFLLHSPRLLSPIYRWK